MVNVRSLCVILTAGALALPALAPAQTGKRKQILQFDRPTMIRLVKGDTLYVRCDSAFVYNRQANNILAARDENADSVIASLQRRVNVGDQTIGLKDSIIVAYRGILAVQDTSYMRLRSHFDAADSLVRRATENTDLALTYIRRVRATGYVASGLAGGVSGGLGIDLVPGGGFDWGGAILGAGIGIGINYLISQVFL